MPNGGPPRSSSAMAGKKQQPSHQTSPIRTSSTHSSAGSSIAKMHVSTWFSSALPSTLPQPVHASHPGPAVYPGAPARALLPSSAISRNTVVSPRLYRIQIPTESPTRSPTQHPPTKPEPSLPAPFHVCGHALRIRLVPAAKFDDRDGLPRRSHRKGKAVKLRHLPRSHTRKLRSAAPVARRNLPVVQAEHTFYSISIMSCSSPGMCTGPSRPR